MMKKYEKKYFSMNNNYDYENFEKALQLFKDKKRPWVILTLKELDWFWKFILELYSEIKDSHSVRNTILITAIAIESHIDLLLKSIFSMIEYKKFSSKELFSCINFNEKIEIIRFFKINYNQKRITKETPEIWFTASGWFWTTFKDISGEKYDDFILIAKQAIDVENKKRWINTIPGSYFISNIEQENHDIYLRDDIIDELNILDLEKVKKIQSLRNKIAHEREISELGQILGISKATDIQIIDYCKIFIRDVFNLKLGK